MSKDSILDTRKAHKAHTNDLDGIGKRPNKGYLSMVLNSNDGKMWAWHVEAHEWYTSKWKSPFRQGGVSVTCLWPTKRQRLTDNPFFFFFREFQPMMSAPDDRVSTVTSVLDDALYHQTKTPIGFWCRRGLNPRSLIQPLKNLPVELTGIHR